jgi:serine/threonine protein kinase
MAPPPDPSPTPADSPTPPARPASAAGSSEPPPQTPTAGFEFAATTPERIRRPEPRPALESVGLHQVMGELSRGGMGVVYKARHVVLDRVVALKMMRADVRLWPEEGQRFEREMRAVARLRHPNILPIYEIGWHDGQPFYTMPFIAGGSLTGQRQRFQGEPHAALRLMAKVARAVQHAHEQGIVHRDLKPGNVLLDEGGEPLVADFGLAKIQDDVELTQTGAVLGTAPYMAPEQAAGRTRQVGPWTDVWALGVMLYELLTGYRPFAGDSTEEIKERILRSAPRRPRALGAKLDKALEAIVLKCLRKDPARRYASAAELADDLDRYLRGQRPQAWEETWSSRLRRIALRHRVPVLLLALALTGLAGLTVFGLLSRFVSSGEPTPAPSEVSLPPPMVLIDERTSPAELHWIPREDGASRLPAPSKVPLSLHSKELHLLELLETPPWPHYRLEVVVRHEDGEENSEVGLFFGLGRHTFADGTYYSFWQLGFAEFGRSAGKVELGVARLKDSPPYAVVGFPATNGAPHSFVADGRGKAAAPWRPLAVEVDADEVRAFWGETCIQKMPRQRMEQFSARVLLGLGAARGDSPPHSRLGVYIHEGSASFQQVILKPLP